MTRSMAPWTGGPDAAARFDEMYRRSPDPWAFASDPYELRRLDTIARYVPSGRYCSAFEPGCSTGELTVRLAARVGRVDAMDVAPSAVRLATARSAALDNVSVRVGALPHDLPRSPVDLIMLSEVGYYLSETALEALVGVLVDGLPAGGRLIVAHWIGRSVDHVLTGDRVHEIVTGVAAHHAMQTHASVHSDPRRAGFLLDIWDRR
jgi:SAM-dependent methyltransferase